MHLMRAFALFAMPIVTATTAIAHEFWISPEMYQIEAGEPVGVHLRVGENFKGASYSYFPTNFARFEIGPSDALSDAEGRLGDRPALTFGPDRDGLWLVVHETTDLRLVYRDWTKFENFVVRHDLGDAVAEHGARALPETGFVEAYRRYAKSLIAVGNGDGSDQRVGLEVEIVAETNPYEPGIDAVTVQLLEKGMPRAQTQLDVFVRNAGDETAEPYFLRSDDNGRVSVPATSGTEVLLSFVLLRPVDGSAEEKEPVWRSLWASLTYSVP